MNYQIENLETMNNWTQDFLKNLNQKETASIICLSGDLGAGKTTLTQMIARYLEVDEPITSPTFVIQKEYQIDNHNWIHKMIHIDAYRLERKEDLEYLGWDEHIQNPNNLIIIEWPEMVEGIAMPSAQTLSISINEDHSRTINVA